MEVCVPSHTIACQDIRSNSGSSTGPSNGTDCNSGDLSMNDLKTCLTEFLSIEELDISTSGFNVSPGKNNKGILREDECNDSDNRKSCNSASEKCFSDCVGFLNLDEPKSLADGLSSGGKGHEDDKTPNASALNGCAISVDECYSQSTPLPAPLKLVSAMKGSRAKQGIAPKNLSVTWAPDVYDPIPTSISHYPSSKNQSYRNNRKKYGKNKQKGGGKSSRGSKGKDKKKQTQKNNGNNNTKCKPLNDDAVGFSEPEAGIIEDFNIVSPDPFCGSSFLKKSVSNLHFPVTEAT